MLRTGCHASDLRPFGRSTWAQIGLLALVCALLLPGVGLAQQRGSISGKVVDPDGLALPGATVTVKEQNTGFTRTAVTASNGAYTVPNLDPGTYTVSVTMPGFSAVTRKDQAITAGSAITLELKLLGVGLAESVTVEGQAPLVETTKSAVGGTLSKNEIEDVPSNFRNFTALTQLIPGMTPQPAASSFEGGQITANGTPAQSNVYLLDGAYNNDDRLGGSQGTQVRLVLDNIGEYQVLSNSYSAEYGGGAGAVINMVSRGGTNDFSGRVYTYFRDDKFNARGHFLPDGAPKPSERTLQMGAGLGGPIIKNRAHFYLTVEKDNEDIAGTKRFPAAAAPLATDFVGAFEVRAMNYFGRVDVQINPSNFLSIRAVREKAPTRGEGFNTNTETIDAQNWEEDLDELAAMSLTSTISDRASNVLRIGTIHEQLNTGEQAYFADDEVRAIGFAGRDPFSIGQQNIHPSYETGIGGNGTQTTIHTYTFDDAFSYFVPSLFGGEHTFKVGGGMSFNRADPQQRQFSGVYDFATDLPYNPANPATFPRQFDITLGETGLEGFGFTAKDRRQYAFVEDKWRAGKKLTLNLGARYDYQSLTPGSKLNIGPRIGFAYDVTGSGGTVVRGGIGKFYLYMPVSISLNTQLAAIRTRFPAITINAASDTCGCILRPDVITDSQGNLGVAQLSPAAQAELARRRQEVLSGSTFNRNPQIDDPDRNLANQWAYSFGVSQQLGSQAALSIDYVGNVSHDQTGIIDINEPVNRVRPGPNGFDPSGELIPVEARGTAYQRVLQFQSRDEFNADYNSLQVALVKRMAHRWSGRVSYTLQKANYVGLGNPDARRVWLDNDIRADYGRFQFDRRHVLASTATVNPWKTLNISAVLSAISGSAINETVGTDVNGDNDNNDRPIAGINDLVIPIRSALDSQGRAVINGLTGPNSVLVDMSLRYQIPLGNNNRRGLDLFYDMFNVLNRANLVNPTGNRASALFMIPTAAQFPRQMQMGVRLRF
jgi:hypothetical protein